VKSGGSSDNLRSIRVSRLCALLFLFIFSFCFFVSADPFDDTQIKISPASQTVDANDNFTVDVYCITGQPIKGFELRISFDSSLVSADSVSEGDIFSNYSTFFNSGTIDNSEGSIVNIFGLIIGQDNVSENGTLVTIGFTAKQYSGTSSIEFIDVGSWTTIVNETGYVQIDVTSGSVEIDGDSEPPGPPPIPPGGGGFFFPPPLEENNAPERPLKPSGPAFVELGVEYTYSSSSFDVDDDHIRLKFDWGDGNFSSWSDYVDSNTTVSMSYNWSVISSYKVRVIAQDSQGLNSSWSEPLNVSVSQEDSEIPPVVEINLSGNMSANESIFFDASGTYDLDGFIVSYVWDFGDGTISNGINATHTYQKSGEYFVTLIITDNLGNTFSKSMIVNINSEGGTIGYKERTAESPFNIFMFLIGSSSCVIVIISIIFKDQIILRYLKVKMHRIENKMKRFLK
jgi:hypothetical protein